MCRQCSVIAVLVIILSLLASGCGVAPPESINTSAGVRAVADPPEPKQTSPRPRARFNHKGGCGGTVVALGSDWLEVKDQGKPARRILCDGTIPGGCEKGVGETDTYRLSDVQIGDVVTILLGVDGQDDISLAIWINRRPGGVIPPCSNDPLVATVGALHRQNQAEQDWEEKGIPIPRQYLDREGRAPWTNPPYPPVAPMPREAKPKP